MQISRTAILSSFMPVSFLTPGIKIHAVEEILKSLGENVQSEEDIISEEAAELVALEFDRKVVLSEQSHTAREDEGIQLEPRTPVVVVMGHVDHGKTTLLDALRHSNVAKREAGGITQHLGAFEVSLPESKRNVTFLDTPGHFAFQDMRACGAKVTDLIVLAVAADDGLMPQTMEAITLIKAAKCPVIVAITKCDLPGANVDKVCSQLASEEIYVEGYGGNVQVVELAIPEGRGLKELEQSLLLESELLELVANISLPAKATVIESRLDRGKGYVALAVVSQGILRVGDPVVVGSSWGKIRDLQIPYGGKVGKEGVGPGRPVEVVGLKALPSAGDILAVLSSEEKAQRIAKARETRTRDKEMALSYSRQSHRTRGRDDLGKAIGHGQGGDKSSEGIILPLIVKGDVQGSVRALKQMLERGSRSIQIVHAGVGAITESDVSLAVPFDAVILGLNVRSNAKVQSEARSKGVHIFYSNVIYEVMEHVNVLIEAAEAKKMRENLLGVAEVLTTFKTTGTEAKFVAGCRVSQGMMKLGHSVQVFRHGDLITEDTCCSIRKHKLSVNAVEQGNECGIGLESFDDFKAGDVLKCIRHSSSA